MMTLQAIRATGDFFTNDDGTEFHYVGVSDFALPKRMLMNHGPDALVRPILIERRQIADRAGYTGPLVARCFKFGHPNNPFGIPPWYDFSVLDKLARMAAEYRTYIDFTAGDYLFDMVLPDRADHQRHLNESEAAIGVFHFVETGNEPLQRHENGVDTTVVKPAKTHLNLRDSGAYGDVGGADGWPADTTLDYVSYHGRRDNVLGNRFPKWLIDMNDQAAVLRSTLHKPVVLKEPIGFEKDAIENRRFNDPYLARLMGQTIAYCGVTFHSTIGLSSDGFDPATRTAFGEFCAGVAGALR